MKHPRTYGIVLRIRRGKNSDKIVTLLTPDLGKVTAVSRSTRDPKSKNVGIINEFHLINCQLYFGSGLPILTQCSLNKSLRIDHSIETLSSLSVIAETVEKLTEEEHFIHGMFELTQETIEMCHQKNFNIVLPLFTVKLLSLLGYIQDFSCCGNCHETFTEKGNIFLHQGKKAVCHTCQSEDDISVPTEAIKLLSFSQKHSLKALHQIEIPEKLMGSLENISFELFTNITNRPRNSELFLKKIAAL